MVLENTKIDLPDTFFEKEKRQNYVTDERMKRIWAVELDLLCEFDRVCKKLNLKYFLDSGTLLGAVRDGRFIPWDDDVDVIMLREDYNKLLKLAENEFESPYFLQSRYSDIEYCRSHAQLRNSNTCAILVSEGKCVKFNQGIFLDIFVLDGISNDEELLKKQFKNKNKIMNLMIKIVYRNNCGGIKRIIKIVRAYLIELVYGKLNKLYDKYEYILCKNNDSDYVDKVGLRRDINEIKKSKKDWFSSAVEIKFEGYDFPIPKDYDNYLKALFGEDYLIPKHIPNMHYEEGNIISTEQSYLDYLNEM